MPIAPTYPGVYIEEVPSGVRTIVGVPTAIAAFIGRAPRGAVDEPVRVQNWGDYEREFGGLAVDYPLSYSVYDFFRNGGGEALVVRLFTPAEADLPNIRAAGTAVIAAIKTVTSTAANAATAAETEAAKHKDEPGRSAAVAVAAAALAKANETGATVANVEQAAQAVADQLAAETVAQIVVDAPGAGAVGAVVAAVITASQASDATRDKIIAAAKAETAKHTTEPAKAGTAAIVEAIEKTPTTATPQDVRQAAEEAVSAALAAALAVGKPLTLKATSPGAWGNNLRVRVDYDGLRDLPGLSKDKLFNLTIRDTATGVEERYLALTLENKPNRVDRVLNEQSSLVRGDAPAAGATVPEAHKPIPATPPNKRVTHWTDSDAATYSAGAPAAGEAGSGVDSATLWPDNTSDLGSEDDQTGLYALDKADIFNILVIPPDQFGADVPGGVYSTALTYCVKRRAMLIVDPPEAWGTFTAAADGALAGSIHTLTGVETRNAALYFPRVKVTDPLLGTVETRPAGGLIAGAYARTDAQRGVWKAPAGVDVSLNGIQGLELVLTDEQNGTLNPLGVNCLRNFRVIGPVIWGARTMRGADVLADDYKYVPIRRLALFIEESLYRGTQWVVFEPNDEPLWAQIRLNVGSFMHDLFRQGAFQGQTPRDAYLVRCDATTTTQSDRNRGIVNIHVGFAPLKPAEFVIIRIQQLAGQLAAA